jgi:hypothetical protein
MEPGDRPAVWRQLEPVLRYGETFPHDPAIAVRTRAELRVVGSVLTRQTQWA